MSWHITGPVAKIVFCGLYVIFLVLKIHFRPHEIFIASMTCLPDICKKWCFHDHKPVRILQCFIALSKNWGRANQKLIAMVGFVVLDSIRFWKYLATMPLHCLVRNAALVFGGKIWYSCQLRYRRKCRWRFVRLMLLYGAFLPAPFAASALASSSAIGTCNAWFTLISLYPLVMNIKSAAAARALMPTLCTLSISKFERDWWQKVTLPDAYERFSIQRSTSW